MTATIGRIVHLVNGQADPVPALILVVDPPVKGRSDREVVTVQTFSPTGSVYLAGIELFATEAAHAELLEDDSNLEVDGQTVKAKHTAPGVYAYWPTIVTAPPAEKPATKAKTEAS